MSKNLVINGVTYNGIESMEIDDANGKKVTYVASDEVIIDLPDPSPAAGPGDIADGKQALDGNGDIITGTLKFLMALPDLGNYPATAADIALGKTAIDADGNVLEGTLEEYLGDYAIEGQCFPDGWNNTNITASVRLYNRKIYGPAQDVPVYMESSAFGDATPEDVLEGRTFTSAAGLKQVGTRPADGGGSGGTVFYTYLDWGGQATFKMVVPYDGITWREYITYDECGILGASVEYDLFGTEQVRVGTSSVGYPIYLNNGGPDTLVPIFGETGVLEFVP